MSEEIIKVLEYISDKLGIAIDWTAANVYPQVMDILGRYRTMKIVGNGVAVFLSLVLAVFAGWLFAKLLKDRWRAIQDQTNTRYHHYWKIDGDVTSNDRIILPGVGAGVSAAVAIPVFCYSISSLIHWALVPEMQYYELLAKLIGG